MPTICCSWDRRINNARRRFKLLSDFKDNAVLDRERLAWCGSASQVTKPLHGLTPVCTVLKRRWENAVVGGYRSSTSWLV